MCDEQDANTGNLELEPNVSMNWATDGGNPRNWSLARMAVSTAVVSGIGFVRYVRLFWRFTGRAPGGSPTSVIALETQMDSVRLVYEDRSFEGTFLYHFASRIGNVRRDLEDGSDEKLSILTYQQYLGSLDLLSCS